MSTPPNDDKDVLGSLPRTRPGRSSARREAARTKRNGRDPATPAKRAKAKPKPAPRALVVAAEAAPPAGGRARIPVPVSKAAGSESRARPIKAPRKAAVTAKPRRAGAAAAKQKPGVVPAAGYAVAADGHGSADPAGALVKLADAGAGVLRGILRRLPS